MHQDRRANFSTRSGKLAPPSGSRKAYISSHDPVARRKKFLDHELGVAEIATAVLASPISTRNAPVTTHIVGPITEYGKIASCCEHFFAMEFLASRSSLGQSAEVDAHYHGVVLLAIDSCRFLPGSGQRRL